jgi:glycosyltransferase involved in cell wall biosynthesis
MQAGFQYAVEQGYDYVVRIDGDGQHPPGEIIKLLQKATLSEADLIIGSRFGASEEMVSTRLRYVSVRMLSVFISLICRNRISDPTSGFWLVRRPLLDYFAVEFPTDYPEPEALALLSRQGYRYDQVTVQFRVRQAGHSSIRSWGTVYYAFKVGLALVVDRFRPVNEAYKRERLV